MSIYSAIISSFSTIFFSELGDNTWFIAFIMSMRYSKSEVFSGAMAANIFMAIISALIGSFAQIIPRKIVAYISTIIFGIFGLKMILEAYKMKPNKFEHEYKEAEEEIRKDKNWFKENPILSYLSPTFLKSFTLTFLEEWGDRSQFSTITLGAIHNTYGIILGAIMGHTICTGLAILLGEFSSKWLSIRIVTLIGGLIFVVLALFELSDIDNI